MITLLRGPLHGRTYPVSGGMLYLRFLPDLPVRMVSSVFEVREAPKVLTYRRSPLTNFYVWDGAPSYKIAQVRHVHSTSSLRQAYPGVIEAAAARIWYEFETYFPDVDPLELVKEYGGDGQLWTVVGFQWEN